MGFLDPKPLTTAEAATTYAAKSVETSKLDKTEASNTYATKTQTAQDIAAVTADPLKPWKDALQSQANAPAIYVNLGDSIANGGNPTSESRRWFNRVSALLTNRPVVRLDDTVLTPAPANGVQVYNGAVGGKTSGDYLTDALVSRIGTLRPQIVTHMVATNDQGTGVSPTQYRANLKSWINKIKAASPNTVNILIGQQQRTDGIGTQNPWSAYMDQLRSLSAELGVPFLNIGAEFMTHGVPGSDRYKLMQDTLHFGNYGNRILAEIIGKYIGTPPWEYLPREVLKTGSAWTGGLKAANTTSTLNTFTIDPKPYIREGIVAADVYAIVSTVADMEFHLVPAGGADTRLNVHRMTPGGTQNHAASAPISLEANTAYTLRLDVYTYSGSTSSFDGAAPYMQFYADLSPA